MVKSGDELRRVFLDFFKEKGHLVLPSAPLVPEDDPSLLWINAGMAPLKPYFDGREMPPDNRIATSQKCIRTNDIKNVGRTARHHTFFEMLGNFSFGDYFKKEAIAWAWEFVTEVLGFSRDSLWVTVYKDDQEAFTIWADEVGVPEDRILYMGRKENFWQIGTGPCGPCSEIHFDRGEDYGEGLSPKEEIEAGSERFLEIWNLVFTQYDYTEEGEYLDLPSKNIDTGMGLERVASLLQGVDSNFETDLIKPIIDFTVEETGIPYHRDGEVRTAYRVIADHIRGITMAIFDGVLPANEGRGYVIRRLLRRAVRFGGNLGYEEPFLYRLVPVVGEVMSGGYPDVSAEDEHIASVVRSEEERFFATLDQGLQILNDMVAEMEKEEREVLSGGEAFVLYDTYGFPLDLTRDVLKEKGYDVDEDGFESEMEEQRRRAREARAETGYSGKEGEETYNRIREELEAPEFAGYRNLSAETEIVALLRNGEEVNSLLRGQEGEVLLELTPFYGESGGQVGDEGLVRSLDEGARAEVADSRFRGGLNVQQVEVKDGELKKGQRVEAVVDEEKRMATARNHSATHLLHNALREVLGDHVKQSGSLVTPEKLRFDFSHYSALSQQELCRVEEIVNEQIRVNSSVEILETTREKAEDMGAVALFGEKYEEKVRVVKIGDFSTELCGGTHVNFSGELGLFKIISESGTAAGIRRIEAVTGEKALEYVNDLEEKLDRVAESLKTDRDNILQRVEGLLEERKELAREITSLKDRLASTRSSDLLEQVEEIDGVKVLLAELKGMDTEALRKMIDGLRQELESGIIVLASRLDEKVIFVAAVTEDLIEEGYNAGEIIGTAARVTGGGGGGRPDMAQAGGSQPDKLPAAFTEVRKIIKEQD
ncbi:MAG: alanine--tRNA ligase [Halanaerobiaceae bacterium]